MASTTYEHFVDVSKMYAAQEQFRDITKMVCDFVKANKIGVLRLKFEKKMQICGLNMAKCVSKRNAGQLPQPFWLGAACGGGSRSAATVPART
jgi:hypothetical protein